MIPNERNRELISGGISASGDFGISDKDQVHIMTILRDTLYTDKVLAVLREYGSNAWDANRMAGKSDLPIDVSLPTVDDPTLRIRDHGLGLSKQDVFEIYTQYGASTKRQSDDVVGSMGIGSKAGFAYSDTFMVTSWHAGTKCTYVAVLDESNRGKINLIHEEPCGDETGVEIQISVDDDDFERFRDTARGLFRHFEPRPNINIDLPEIASNRIQLPSGILIVNGTEYHGWSAVMGCVPYKIDTHQLTGVPDAVRHASGVLFFNIGDVTISASREELKYTDATKACVVAKFECLLDEFIAKTLKEIEGCSDWGKRLRLSDLHDLTIDIPCNKTTGDDKDDPNLSYTARKIRVECINKNYAVFYSTWRNRGRQETLYSIAVDDKTRLVVKNDRRALAGFQFKNGDCVVTLIGAKTINDVTQALHIDGIPTINLSELPWVKPTGCNAAFNIKHRVRAFVIDSSLDSKCHPLSKNWSVVDRIPLDTDVFVVLDTFNVRHDDWKNNSDFYNTYFKDKVLANYYKIDMPAVYGYKTTMNKPVYPADCLGMQYDKWHEEFVAKLLSIDIASKELDDAFWLNCTRYYWDHVDNTGLKNIITALGNQHLVSSFLIKQITKNKKLSRNYDYKTKLNHLYHAAVATFKTYKSGFAKQQEAVISTYPLLDDSAIRDLINGNVRAQAWLQYIQAIDCYNATRTEARRSA
jgi:hypothetical protein